MNDKYRQDDGLDQAIRDRLRRLADAPVDVTHLKRRLLRKLASVRRAVAAAARQGISRRNLDEKIEPW